MDTRADIPDTPDEFRKNLSIDRDDLDSALETHAELYYHACDAVAQTKGRRDAYELNLREAEASAYERVRSAAIKAKEQPTETAIKQRLRLDPELQKMQRQLLALSNLLDRWEAVKDGFYQRGFMLRDLVQSTITQRADIALAHGNTQSRETLIKQRISEERLRRRSQKG